MKKYTAIFCIMFFVITGMVIFVKHSEKPKTEGIARENISLDKNRSEIHPNDISFSFAIMGDSQDFGGINSRGGYKEAIEFMKDSNVSFALSVGDVLNCRGDRKCRNKLEEWKNRFENRGLAIYPAMGNHDRIGGVKSDEIWQEVFDLPANGPAGFSEFAYSFNYGNSHFVVLDSNRPAHTINDAQRAWLENDLASAAKQHTFIFVHEPAFPISTHQIGDSLDAKKEGRDAFWRIVDSHDVTAVFAGHEHLHSRIKIDASLFPGATNEVYQFIVGPFDTFQHSPARKNSAEYVYKGRDFMIVKVDGSSITAKVYSPKGNLLNTFSFVK